MGKKCQTLVVYPKCQKFSQKFSVSNACILATFSRLVNQSGAFQDQSRWLDSPILLFGIVNVMAILAIKLNEYSLDTFITVVGDLTNQNDNDKTKDIDEMDEYLNTKTISETN